MIMEDRYQAYVDSGFAGRSFIGDWLLSRQLNECVGKVAEAALGGDEAAVTALLRIEGEHRGIIEGNNEIMTIDCPRTACEGCARLIIAQQAQVEVIYCQERQAGPTQD